MSDHPALLTVAEHRIGNTTYTRYRCGDGSPTLSINASANDRPEAMHHSAGALAETLYIYAPVIDAALAMVKSPHILSLGLGLGYVEMTLVARTLSHAGPPPTLESFESDDNITQAFLNWLDGKDQGFFAEAYGDVATHVATSTETEPEALRARLKIMRDEGRFVLSPALTPATTFSRSAHGICFDAFSSRTSPSLWSDEFLTDFLRNAADDECALSTYASTGSLKRALTHANFTLFERAGFAGKRESTFALHGLKMLEWSKTYVSAS